MRILTFGTYQASDHPRVRVLADGLRERGHQVAEANVPLGLSTRDRVAMLGARSGALQMAGRLASSWSRLVGKALRARRSGRPDAVLVGYMGHFDVWLARALFPRTTIALDHLVFAATTAQDRGVGDAGLKQRLLRFLDASALRIADVVVVDTEEHRDLVPERLRSKAVVVPVGAQESWYDAAASGSIDTDGPLRVVFYGLFTPLQGAETIGAAIGLLPSDGSVTVTMVGSGQDLDASRAAAEGGAPTEWIPWVDAAELPALVASHDVGIGIMGTTPKALKVVPNKVYQCAAAGLAVVTSDTAPQRRTFGDAVTAVPAGDAAALAAAVRALAADRALLAERRTAAAQAAERFRPAAAVAPLDDRLRAGAR
ncbi:glycosyltransferase involved in cell wall biosynthesis [Curtobacterium flaccumfaciens]|uniref:Glycosyltransferase involved in cell wall biosynthesis n=1 Tax=Curtobacterium flaccumfaciens TaxID=2035 RepID=A0A4R6DLA7_9MICO|nr:glycosyltransferase [Curtobacterium flaccumfaciens]TDN45675.1 glycosyltransferase involved in cell wall biosynthesis [Curtobacterium flaccumfaciens]